MIWAAKSQLERGISDLVLLRSAKSIFKPDNTNLLCGR